jgi:6,7-dimethyl-8-ribityllumazine synthase
MCKASEAQNAASALLSSTTDLLGSTSLSDLTAAAPAAAPAAVDGEKAASTTRFDAVIAVGVLVKGETMHFEYIADAVNQGLMRVQLDAGVFVVSGLLTVLSQKQALARAGLTAGGHNQGEDWGLAAVEIGIKRREMLS